MAKDSGSGILIAAAVAAGGYFAYKNGLLSSLGLSPSAASGPVSSPAGGGTVTASPAPASGSPSSPSYTGPSLSDIFSQLKAAEIADYGANSALSCAGAGSVDPAKGAQLGNLQAQMATLQNRAALGDISAVQQLAQISIQIAQLEADISAGAQHPASCSDPIASYEVHNWYLVNRTNANVPDGLLNDGGQSGPLSAYWAWAAPQLQKHFPGLAGADVYAGLGALIRHARGW